jgi:hypothetical protein
MFKQTILAAVSAVALLSGAAAQADESASYGQGFADWQTYKPWFDAQTGDRAAGVRYWAANRNVPGHLSCTGAGSDYKQFGDKLTFIVGCQEAERRLDPIDARRHSDPEYRLGFADAAKGLSPQANAPAPVQAPVTSAPVQTNAAHSTSCRDAGPGTFCSPDQPVQTVTPVANAATPSPPKQAPTEAAATSSASERVMRLYVRAGQCDFTTGWMQLLPNDHPPANAEVKEGSVDPFAAETGVSASHHIEFVAGMRATGKTEAETDDMLRDTARRLRENPGTAEALCKIIGPFKGDVSELVEKLAGKYHDLVVQEGHE